MIALDRVLAHAELSALARRAQGGLELSNEATCAKRRNTAPHAQSDV